jgi:DNA-binding SARP family transcriptional activator/tetratricopeptide (TPR) repeat protein
MVVGEASVQEITMEPTLHIRLLGGFSLIYADRQVTGLNTMRLQSLLAYLVLHRDVPQPRQHLASLFWPDTTEAQARNNLRQLLHQLRQAFPDALHFLSADKHVMHWHPITPFSLDVAEFEQALMEASAATRRHDQHVLQAALERADRLYRGELLPGCYDEWILPERERLRQLYLQALEHLLRLLEEQGDTVAAIRSAQRLLGLDPLSEDLYRRLMRLFALKNDRASALHIYHTCVTTLQREMGVDPDPATREAYERLLRQETPATQADLHQPLPTAPPKLIGRTREWERLNDAWQHASKGGPRFVLVTGEAGMGKSRLAEEFLLWAGRQGAVTAKARSYAAEGQLSFAPVTQWLRSDGLRGSLKLLDAVWLTEVVRLLPELSVEQPALSRHEPAMEYGQRQRFFEALARAIFLAPQPLLLLLDDLQWCDQETLEWVHFLLRFDPLARLLVVGCAREEELSPQHPLHPFLLHLRTTVPVTEIELLPLDAAETGKLGALVADREFDLDEGLRLYHETAGYPLFIIEMMRIDGGRVAASSEAGHPHQQGTLAEAQTLPPRMYAVLAGRLLQLSASARELVALAAVIGRAFTLDLLITAGQVDADSAVRALDELWHKRVVGEHSANSYDFTHDKLCEVAYGEISVPQRRLLHLRVARALETIHADDIAPVSGQIASHYERAGMIEQALSHYGGAATVAGRLYANEEAINLLSRGLALLELLPASLKRQRQELSLQLILSSLYRVTRGWGAPELQRVLERALALCDTVGDDAQRAQALYGLESLYVVRARLEKVQFISEELHALCKRSPEAVPPFAGTMWAGAQLHMGKIAEANEQFEQVIAAQDPDQLLKFQESPGVNYVGHPRAWQSQALWCLGYPRQALECVLEEVRQARDRHLPFGQAQVSVYLALLQQMRADEATARRYAEEALTLTTRYQAPYYRTWAAILVNYALACEQPDEERIGHLHEAIADFKALSARLRLPYYLSLLASVYGKAGRAREGLACIEEALVEARTHNERWWDAELHRQWGELLLMDGADASDVEEALLRAIEIAQSQQARSLELRARVSLARLWMAQKRSEDARHQLSDVYGWFTEGFETPDLRAARLLLGQR